jgi:D-amino-acid dehydrogenase
LPDELPEINAWSGLRPSSPDGMPIIGPLTKSPRIIIASGHGMLGTMMSLGTGKLVADQVTHTSTSRESLKFLPSRPR